MDAAPDHQGSTARQQLTSAVICRSHVPQLTHTNEMQTTNRPQTPAEIEAEKRQRENDQRWPLASADREVRRKAIADFIRRSAPNTNGADPR
jgi:hypothetical protein